MKRILLVLALVAVGLVALACGGGSDDGGTAEPGDNGGGGGGATTITVTITDTGLTVDNATLTEGPVVFKVVNQSTMPRDVYLAPLDRAIAEIPIDSDNQVDVLNQPPLGVKIAANVENVPAAGEREKNIVAFEGTAIVFSNAPGDFAAGFYKEVTINAK